MQNQPNQKRPAQMGPAVPLTVGFAETLNQRCKVRNVPKTNDETLVADRSRRQHREPGWLPMWHSNCRRPVKNVVVHVDRGTERQGREMLSSVHNRRRIDGAIEVTS
jgi:hypothetical protein